MVDLRWLVLLAPVLWPVSDPLAADEPVFPGKAWETQTPAEAGLEATKLDALRDLVGGRGCVVRHGRLVYTWGDASKSGDVASAFKPVLVHFLLLLLQEKTPADVDEPVARWEPRLNKLNEKLGFKDRKITWRHLACQTSCYGVTELPGAAYDYSDYNMALFFDTLFLKVHKTSYERLDADILKPRLTDVLECQDGPSFMAFGTRDRPGRFAISPRDFCRFGLVYLNRGKWRDQQLVTARNVDLVLHSPVSNSLPRTQARKAEMIEGQRSIGGGHNQTDHLGSYSFAWWLNGVDRAGKRHWPAAPLDTFAALGHGGQRALVMIPSLDLVVSWNDTRVTTRELQNRALALLAATASQRR